MLAVKHNSADLTVSRELIEAGKVMPVVGDVPLRDVPEAMRQMERGSAQGKVSISVGPLTDA